MAQTAERKREYMRSYNAAHKEQRGLYYDQDYRKEHCGPIRIAKGKIKLRNREFIAQQKAGKVCAVCHKAVTLLFHHVDPATKCFTIGGDGEGRAIQVLIEEIAKCVLWCKPCHCAYHNTQRTNFE
jgi:hypothetical protein